MDTPRTIEIDDTTYDLIQSLNTYRSMVRSPFMLNGVGPEPEIDRDLDKHRRKLEKALTQIISDRLMSAAMIPDAKDEFLASFRTPDAAPEPEPEDPRDQEIRDLRQQVARLRRDLPTGWYHILSEREAIVRGFPAVGPGEGAEYQAMDGSRWRWDDQRAEWELHEYAPTDVRALMNERDEWQAEAENSAAERIRLSGEIGALQGQKLDLQKGVDELAQAIRLSVEYVGVGTLQALPGWEWYDALANHAPAELAPLLEQWRKLQTREAAEREAEG
ncbi:hypothetical protein SEA_SKOG_115 [Gordonia phage Skog]|uniref:Uncharacterized protein n=1 Tax=Gordonia phage Skog TaxID=2704033 RepID=A0A6G6XJM3_9CAUD|nr:hypothetical protein KHQ85_gp115 [Gordonia phage Skog]QIG58267.1 hypothetical protein SEA_SKOG_115 [Gordonia phage Skog]